MRIVPTVWIPVGKAVGSACKGAVRMMAAAAPVVGAVISAMMEIVIVIVMDALIRTIIYNTVLLQVFL